jgi:hypothetical protein
MTIINAPEVVAEVSAVFAAYEDALVRNDVAVLEEAFWASDLTVRYGLSDRQYGRPEIDAWRRAAPGVPPARRLGSTVIVTFGRDMACVSTEFRDDSRPGVGRQSQTWMRLDGVWRIVVAHVSREAP